MLSGSFAKQTTENMQPSSEASLNVLNCIYDDFRNTWLRGGGAVRAYEIYKRFPQNVKVTVLTGFYPGAKRIENVFPNITYVRLGLPWSYAISRITYTLLVPFYLIRHNKKYDCIVDDHTAYSPIFSFLYTKRPVIGSFQNLHSQKSAEGKGFFKAIFAKIFDWFALRYFKYYTTGSPAFISLISERARHKDYIKLIQYGVNEEFFKIEKAAEDYILFIGRCEIYQKGIDILLEAYSRLQNKPKLIIAGGGIDEKKVKQTAKKLNLQNVEFTGYYSHEEVLKLLERAICVVMPSRFESFGVTALEAMASQTAFIGTKIPSLQDVVQDCGLFVESENSKELAEAMEKIIQNAELRNTLAQKGRVRARFFTWEKISNDFLEVIRDVCASHRENTVN